MTDASLRQRGGLGSVTLSELWLFVTLFALENFACLVPDNQYVFSSFKYSDIGVILAFLWAVPVILRNVGHGRMKAHFLVPAVLAMVSICLSAVSGYIHLGQPVISGILPFRRMIVTGLLCVAVFFSLRSGRLSRQRLVTMLYIIGVIELVLFTSQALLAGRATFLQLNTGETRLGMTRLRVPYLLTAVLGIFSFRLFLTDRRLSGPKKAFHIVFCFWSIILLAFVAQHRAPTIILVVSYISAFFLWRGNVANKLVGFVLLMVLISAFMSTVVFRSAVSVLSGEDTGASTATLSIRESGQQYYLERLQDSLLFGYGIPSDNYPPATLAAGEGYNYYLADNGVYGFAYELGLFGLFWLAITYVNAFMLGASLYRRNGNFSYLQYFIFETGNLYMGMHWFYYYPLPFMAVLALLDFDYGMAVMLNEP
jgi:hypothetical protein